MTAKPHNFDWMHVAVYQPPALPDYGRTRAPVTACAFGLLCVLAVIGVALWAVNN